MDRAVSYYYLLTRLSAKWHSVFLRAVYMVESTDGPLTLTSATGMVAGNASCLSFWYETKGCEMEVEVLVQAQPSGKKTHAQQQRLYTAGDYWRRARWDIPAQEGPFQVLMIINRTN